MYIFPGRAVFVETSCDDAVVIPDVIICLVHP